MHDKTVRSVPRKKNRTKIDFFYASLIKQLLHHRRQWNQFWERPFCCLYKKTEGTKTSCPLPCLSAEPHHCSPDVGNKNNTCGSWAAWRYHRLCSICLLARRQSGRARPPARLQGLVVSCQQCLETCQHPSAADPAEQPLVWMCCSLPLPTLLRVSNAARTCLKLPAGELRGGHCLSGERGN